MNEKAERKLSAETQAVDMLVMLVSIKTAELAVQLAAARGEALQRPVPVAELHAALDILQQEAQSVSTVLKSQAWDLGQHYTTMLR